MKQELLKCPKCSEVSLQTEVLKPLHSPRYPIQSSVDLYKLNEVTQYKCLKCGFEGRE